MTAETQGQGKSPFAIFAIELRKLGFFKAWNSTAGGMRCTLWTRTTPDAPTLGYRQLRVQIWADGHHRVSHGINNRETTEPTDFETVAGLHTAVAHEMTRLDNLNVATALAKAETGR
jgi:hypothetical protein